MKKINSYILTIIAIVPIILVLIFTGINDNKEYYIVNESGDRKELGNVKFEAYDSLSGDSVPYDAKVFDTILTIDSGKVDSEKNSDAYKYGYYPKIKDNKDLLRGKEDNEQFIADNDKYVCYASVKHEDNKQYLDIYIKDIKSKKINNVKYDFNEKGHVDYYVDLVKITDGYLNVVINKKLVTNPDSYGNGDQTFSNENYKFDLSSGKFIKKYYMYKSILTEHQEDDTVYSTIYLNKGNKEIDDPKDGKLYGFRIHNLLTDKAEDVKIPVDMNITNIINYDGKFYLFNYDGEMLEMTADGKAEKIVKLIENNNPDTEYKIFSDITIKDNKIYGVCSTSNKVGILKKSSIKVFDINTKREIYSGDIMKKGLFDGKARPVNLEMSKFISK